MNPFMAFPNPNGNNPFEQQINPFSRQEMVFQMSAIQDSTGCTKNMIMQLSIPLQCTEHDARKKILEMGHEYGWRFTLLRRLDNSQSIEVEG
jgi:hypothetical protein